MQNNKIKFAFLFICIGAVNLLVFYPSFLHVARGDHLLVLIDTEKFDRFPDLLNFLYSHNRNNVHVMGDYLLFRPVFFLMIALQKSLFGLHFTWWQITSWLLHLGVIIQLVRVLMLIRFHVIAFGFALCFSVLHISQEMVIWHNISGYLVFLILLLEAFYHFIRYITEENTGTARLAFMLSALTLACFACEFGVIANLIFFIVFLILKQKRGVPQNAARGTHTAFLLLPAGIFLASNLYDYFIATQFKPFPLQCLGVTEFVQYAGVIFMIAVFYGFLPYFFSVSPGNHLQLTLANPQTILDNYHAHPALVFLNASLIGLIAVCFLLTISEIFFKQDERKRYFRADAETKHADNIRMVFWMAAAMFISYALLLTLRSIIRRYTFYYLGNLHHFYILSLFLAIGLYCLFFLLEAHISRNRKLFYVLTLCAALLSVLLNATKTHQINTALRKQGAPWRAQMEQLQNFISLHKNEQNFSYRLVWGQVDEYVESSVGPLGKEEWIRGNLSDLLFKRYTNRENPKYYLLYFNKEGLRSFASREEAQNYLGIRLKAKE